MKVICSNNVQVKIYNSKKGMRAAIRRIGYNCSHTESMVIPVTVYSFSNGEEAKLPICAEMYTHLNVSMPVLVHETLHAATTVLRKKRESLNLGRDINYREELLAYTQTSILQDILMIFFPKHNSNYTFGDIKEWAVGSVNENHKKLMK